VTPAPPVQSDDPVPLAKMAELEDRYRDWYPARSAWLMADACRRLGSHAACRRWLWRAERQYQNQPKEGNR